MKTKNRFRVLQSSTRRSARDGEGQEVPTDLWDWSLWIEPVDGAKLDEARWVIYGLDPCFPNPNRIVRNRDDSFLLSMSSAIDEELTWGTFPIHVTIARRDGVIEGHEMQLNLTLAPGEATPSLRPLRDSATYDEAEKYYRRMKKKSAWGYAREALDIAEQRAIDKGANTRLWIAQQRVLCTYQDSAHPLETRLREALVLLRKEPCNLDSTRDPETLGLAGAVYKRLWQTEHSREHLEASLGYYRRGYDCMLASRDLKGYDAGAFTGTNAAFLYDMLAYEIGAVDAARRQHLLDQATAIRRQLAQDLPALQAADKENWWIASTLFDTYFGLAALDPACGAQAVEQARFVSSRKLTPWKRRSSGGQLLDLARLHKKLWPRSAQYLDDLLRDAVSKAFGGGINVGPVFDGKLGLALSGGGFRASLFHIGLLARLAELDLLRHVQVISCVSGGSIVGAHYYLLLRELLQRKADEDIERADYLLLVETLLAQFLAGVQQNVRVRVAASWTANLKMVFQPRVYSRSQRLGELYEECLYKRVKDTEEDWPRYLNELFIVPRRRSGDGVVWEDSFSPKVDNWRRSAKVPILCLNATSLNTGRNWQFTASWMGEPLSYGTSVDSTERLEPVYYSEAPTRLQRYRLGHAVAASSCVPALFTPIVIADLYTQRIVRLVDGGVHDNQGARALLDEDCDAIIVSDASGQMESLKTPSGSELGVLGRTNSVLQARIRVAQHQELQARQRAGLVRRCAFLHLRKQIEGASVPPLLKADEKRTAAVKGTAPEYEIDAEYQRCLASVRTDLDSFTDREALSLMMSGYAMAKKFLPEFASDDPPSYPWRFLDVEDVVKPADKKHPLYASFLQHIRVGSRLALKVWFLHPVLKTLGIAIVVAAGIGATYSLWSVAYAEPPLTMDLSGIAQWVFWTIVTLVLGAASFAAVKGLKLIRRVMNPTSMLAQIVIGITMSITGSVLALLHLWTFDRLFLRLGRVRPPQMPQEPSRQTEPPPGAAPAAGH